MRHQILITISYLALIDLRLAMGFHLAVRAAPRVNDSYLQQLVYPE